MKPTSNAEELALRDGKPFFIYALVCPLTLEVKYVGQTIDMDQRTRGKVHNSRHNTPVAQWHRSLGYLKPYRVILERGINRHVTVKATIPDIQSEEGKRKGLRRSAGLKTVWLSACLEAKWIKRFRRTALNKSAGQIDAARLLTNQPLPWDEQETK